MMGRRQELSDVDDRGGKGMVKFLYVDSFLLIFLAESVVLKQDFPNLFSNPQTGIYLFQVAIR